MIFYFTHFYSKEGKTKDFLLPHCTISSSFYFSLEYVSFVEYKNVFKNLTKHDRSSVTPKLVLPYLKNLQM